MDLFECSMHRVCGAKFLYITQKPFEIQKKTRAIKVKERPHENLVNEAATLKAD